MDTIYSLAVLLGMAIGIAVGIGTFLSEVKERKERPQEIAKFREALQTAIQQEEVTWERIKIMASYHSLAPHGIKRALEALVGRALGSENEPQGERYLSKIESFLRDLKAEEPFEGLPGDIKLHLHRINEELSNNDHLVQPLAERLKHLLEHRSAVQRRQRRVAYVSLVIGLGGFCVGILSYWG